MNFDHGSIVATRKAAAKVDLPKSSNQVKVFVDENGILSTVDFSGKVTKLVDDSKKQVIDNTLDEGHVVIVRSPKVDKIATHTQALQSSLEAAVVLLNNKIDSSEVESKTAELIQTIQTTKQEVTEVNEKKLTELSGTVFAAVNQANRTIDQLKHESFTNVQALSFKGEVLDLFNTAGRVAIGLNERFDNLVADGGVLQ